MFAYFASPIDQGNASLNVQRTQTLSRLVAEGYTVFNPHDAFEVPGNASAKAVEAVNRAAIDQADIVFAMLPAGVASIGVPMEIEYATAQGIPTVVMLDKANSHSISIKAKGNRVWVFTGWEQFTSHLSSVWSWAARGRIPVLSPLPQSMLEPVSGEFLADGTEYDTDLSEFEREIEDVDVHSMDDAYVPPVEHPLKFAGTMTPNRANPDDAGYDLVVKEDHRISAGTYWFLPCGLHVELPPDTFGWIVARSSTFPRYGLHVLPGIVDRGFDGEIGVSIYFPGVGGRTVEIKAGTRLAQLVLLPNLANSTPIERVPRHELNRDSSRGSKSFGSSGL